MLLEFFSLLLSFGTLLTILAIASRVPPSPDDEARTNEKSKVVTLGPIQTILNIFRILGSQSLPNYEICENMSKAFGGVVSIKIPFKSQVTLNIADISVAKSIMSSAAWVNKFPEDYYLHECFDGKPLGLIFSSGGYWKEGRKLTLKLLHQLGFFREEQMEKIIQFEVAELVRDFRRKIELDGGATTVLRVHHTFHIYALNIVYQVMVGRRFEPEDPNANKLVSTLCRFNAEFNPGTNFWDMFPMLRHLPFVAYYKNLSWFNQVFRDHFQKEQIEPRRRAGSYRTDPVDFVDHFLLEIDRKAADNPCYLNDTHLVACLRDLVAGALDTTNASLEHGILQVCLQPTIQTKVQDEIEQVIGTTRDPCYDDRASMPYTQAVLWEVLRYSSPVAIAARCPLRDAEIHGTVIPKDSSAGINLYAIHHSKEIWSDPDRFRPERFLNEKNELVNLDKIMPFGHGKRVCVGEFVAKRSFFIFFVSLMQKFQFELSESHPPPCLKNTKGLSHTPSPYYVKITDRRGIVQKSPAC